MRAIVTGMISTYPVGGVVWDYAQYALGLERMGFDVYYLEDTGWQTYDPRTGMYGEDCGYGVQFLQDSLQALSPKLGTRWHFRAMDGRSFGIEADQFASIVGGADLFLNVSGGTLLRDAYMECPRKVLIDTDPGWNHFVNFPKWDKSPGWQDSHGWRAHDHFFTFAEMIGRDECLLPDLGIQWQPTRPTVLVDLWRAEQPGETWTTVMTWNNFDRSIEYKGRQFGTKEREFPHVESLPRLVSDPLEIAVGGTSPPRDRWRNLGWSVVDSEAISKTHRDYQSYIQQSKGEFSVAKNVYVDTRSGWFSCRSVCYLAAGRPVVVQDTGFSEILPTGAGLFAFTDLDEAVAALTECSRDYKRHQSAAEEIAREYFGVEPVIGSLLNRSGLSIS